MRSKAIKNTGTCSIVFIQQQPALWNEVLYTLYYPLMDKDACLLYCLLQAYKNEELLMENLVAASRLSDGRFTAARNMLEQFLLVQTFYDPLKTEWLLLLKPVMSPAEFLRNETYSRLYLNVEGSVRFDMMKRRYLQEAKIPETMQDISQDFDTARLEAAWDASKERTFERLKPKLQQENRWNFNFASFFKGTQRWFPAHLKTEENLELIASLAGIYGITEKQMRIYVQRAINPDTQVLSEEILRQQVLHSTKLRTQSQDPYDLSPVAFLAARQHGAPVSRSDKLLLEKLVTQYEFPMDVVNIMVEFILKSSDQQFARAYVEKIAGTWARAGIDSREKALEYVQQHKETSYTRSGKGKSAGAPALPEWYSHTDSGKKDPEMLAEVEAMQEALKARRNRKDAS